MLLETNIKVGNNIHNKILLWCDKYIHNNVFILLAAFLVGIFAGLGAFILKYLIAHCTIFVTHTLDIETGNTSLFIYPFLGIMIVGIYMRYILHQNIAHGVSKLKFDLSQSNYNLRSSLMYSPILASSVTIGFGGSAGAEGPIAYAGAAIGSNIGKWFKMQRSLMLLMIGCGAGAGISGIFKAPIGGMLFTLEVLKIQMTTISILAVLIAALSAWMMVYLCTGCTIDINFVPKIGFDTDIMPYVLIFGVICGLYSLYYSYIMNKMDSYFDNMMNPWGKNIIGGIILASLIFLFPNLFGEGYNVISHLINGNHASILNASIFYKWSSNEWVVLGVIAGIVAVKVFATATTNSAGGVGGDFAPTLFAGCLLGYLFASITNCALDTELPTGLFALIGMTGAMSGITRAPLMAVFLTVEMSGGYQFLLPLLSVSAISFAMVYYLPQLDFITSRAHKKV